VAYDVQPESLSASQAAVIAINKAGGVAGHQLQIVSCDSQNLPADEVTCAEKMASSNLVAMANTFSFLSGSTVAAILEKAAIPMVYPLILGATPSEENSPLLIRTLGTQNASGQPDSLTFPPRQVAAFAKASHLDGVYALVDNIPAALAIENQSSGALKQTLSSAGLTYSGFAAIPPASSDYSSFVNEVEQSGAHVMQLISGGAAQDQIIESAYQTGFKGDVFLGGPLLPSELKTLGTVADNHVYSISPVPLPTETSIPGVQRFNQDMDAAHAAGVAHTSATDKDLFSLEAWVQVQIIADVISKMTGPPNAATFLNAIQHTPTINVDGVVSYTPGQALDSYYLLAVKNSENVMAYPQPVCIALSGCGSVQFGGLG
jgi:ABC-type branched-subunit amino acid transport system substrate-binding protein